MKVRMKVFIVVFTFVFVFVLSLVIMSLTLKGSGVFPAINIPDGEFLHYGNYFEGKKYADLYVVTEKAVNGKGKYYYHSYIDIINVADNRKPSKDYKNWPSFCISDPELGSTIESEANIEMNVLNNWLGYENLIHWHIKVDYEKREGEYIIKYINDGETNEIKDSFKKIRPDIPSSCHWATFFLQSRFADYQSKGLEATLNPVYLPLPAKYTYRVASHETMQTNAGSFNVIKYQASAFISVLSTPEVIGMVFKLRPKPGEPVRKAGGPFAVYVEDSERRLTVKMENTAGLGGDYILEEVSNVKSGIPLFEGEAICFP